MIAPEKGKSWAAAKQTQEHDFQNAGANYSKSSSSASGVSFPFGHAGWLHQLIEQNDRICLVRRSKDGKQIHFEVVVLQRHAPRQWPDGRITTAGFHYPKSELWGEAGWSYVDMATARRRYLSEARKRGVEGTGNVMTAEPTGNASELANVCIRKAA
jgi:hypothetical protein